MVGLAKTKNYSNYFESYLTSFDLVVNICFGKFQPTVWGRKMPLTYGGNQIQSVATG